jgi:PAS domain-containing protein
LIRYDAARNEFGPSDPEQILAEKVQMAERFEQHNFERRRPNGTVIEVQGGPLPGGGFVSTYTDITERKQTEERIAKQVTELDQSRRATLNMMADAELARNRAEQAREEMDAARRHLQAALDNMTDGIYMVDANMCCALFNQHYRDLVALPGDVIEIGRTVRDAIRAHAERGDYGPGDIDEIVGQRLARLANDEPGELQMVIDGGEKYLELRKAPVEGGGAVVIVSDATTRTKAQKELSSALAIISDSIEYASQIQRSILASVI